MPLDPRLSLEDHWERRKAARHLQRMDIYEDFARACDLGHASMQVAYGARYRELIGVFPDQRHELRECLRNIRGITVEALLQSFRRHSNGS